MNSKYCEQYDAFYDSEKDKWLEETCSDVFCEYCSNRPSKPSEVIIKKPVNLLKSNNSRMITIKDLKEEIKKLPDEMVIICGTAGGMDPCIKYEKLNQIKSKYGHYYVSDSDIENYKIDKEDKFIKKVDCLIVL